MSKGANINEPNFSGITPLQSANSCRNDTISKIILSQETPNSSSATLTRPNVIQQNLASTAGHKATSSSSLHLPALNSKKRQVRFALFFMTHEALSCFWQTGYLLFMPLPGVRGCRCSLEYALPALPERYFSFKSQKSQTVFQEYICKTSVLA